MPLVQDQTICIFCHQELRGEFMDIHPHCLMQIYGMVKQENIPTLIENLRRQAMDKKNEKKK